jgi:hypothetical protein
MPKTQEQRLGEVKRFMERVSQADEPTPEELLGLRIALDKAIWTMLKAKAEPERRPAVVVGVFQVDATLRQIENVAEDFRSRFSGFELDFDLANRALLARKPIGGEDDA